MDSTRPHVVVVGGGFGGLEVVKRLRRVAVRVTLIDRNNFHLFQPLLYQVATGGLSPANIATPLRMILRRVKNCDVMMAAVTGIDLERNVVFTDSTEDPEVSFDYLVIAAGAAHSYFGHDDWENHAPGLKSIPEATEIRRRIYRAFETAELSEDPERRSKLMTFVVIGGGPTGIEMAGAMAEIARNTLRHDFRHIDPRDAKIHLVEAGKGILSGYSEALQQKARRQIESLGVEIHLNTLVTDIDADHVIGKRDDDTVRLDTETVVWAAGVKANALGPLICESAGIEAGHGGRVPVSPNLTVGSHDHVWVIGDLASCRDESGNPLPGVAPVAIQQGKYVARILRDAFRSGRPVSAQLAEAQPFSYSDPGSMATIGRAAAVARLGRFEFSGFIAWMLWLLVHLMQIVRFQNRLLILTQWAWNYLTFNRAARIIVDPESRFSTPTDKSRSLPG